MMRIQVTERDCIKPSSPTPPHLRKHELSFLDQIATPIFMPMILFYTNNVKIYSDRVKQSLSEILTQYYPLAGRVIDDAYVDCNDQGVHYVQAQVNCLLSDVISQPNPNQLNKLLPYNLDNVGDLILAVQVNIFDCGGMAIGICISHKIVDAFSVVTFLNSWALVSRGDCDIKNSAVSPPLFDVATLFPPRSISGYKPSTGIIRENIVTKRFVFSASVVASLRSKYTENNSNERYPTRIEALSSFIWARFIASTQGEPNPKKIYQVLHAVNLRTRMDPPLPEYHIGNVSRFAIATLSFDRSKDTCYGLVGQMRDALKTIDSDYLSTLRDGGTHLSFLKQRVAEFMKGEVVSLNFTSLCRFPLYETDFGWGKPVWVGSASLPFKNLVVFMDTESGGGIEAWVNLKEEDMAKFQEDEQLLSCTYQAQDAKI
ncbi:PREDICTED: vinorine synthase [Prunus dulcis]|uniref:PREDICTED: vinorine synthase n=2 Tax=Prunus dulcis TaxID=3755 RepID=A0A5E4EBP8_PRUDU|nr:stemmadenine O-acetyltransferase-like [Prunus dulcis]VVA13233.1 PREDICTED: vinorine synthase [Prunus dulcis]